MSGQKSSLVAAGGTHEGLVRDQNEDRWLVDTARGVFCVIDGVGGHAGGERAAGIALDMIRTRLARETGTAGERLREAITLANNAILDVARADASLAGMTCVLTAAVVAGGHLTAGHVGDSRLYKLRAGDIRKLTRDHSPVGEREDAGELTEADAMRHPRRNEVFRDVGGQPHAPDDDEFVDIVESTFEPDAALVLCSDGLSDQVSSQSIRRIVEEHAGRPGRAVEELVRAANDAGGKDNVTAIVVEGEGYAAAVRAHARGRAAAGWSARRGQDAQAPDAGAITRTRRGWIGAGGWLVLGALVGLAAALAMAWYYRPQLLRAPSVGSASSTESPSRTWKVGLTGEADAASIGDALVLAPGDYREAVTIRVPVRIEGPETAVLRPPLGADPGWTAITVNGVTLATLEGFTIAGAEGQPLSTGLHVASSEVRLSGLRVSGASDAGVRLDGGARASISVTFVHDNAGTGIVANPGSHLTLQHSVVLRNGTRPGRPLPGIDLADGAEAVLFGNAIGDNGGPGVSGWPAARWPALLRDNLVRPVPNVPGRRSSTSPRVAGPGSQAR